MGRRAREMQTSILRPRIILGNMNGFLMVLNGQLRSEIEKFMRFSITVIGLGLIMTA